MSPDAQFAAISDAMSGVGLASDKTRLAMDIFGKSGGALIQLLGSGSEGLNQFGKEAEDLGLLMGDAREGVGGVNDAIDKMKMAWGALRVADCRGGGASVDMDCWSHWRPLWAGSIN